MSDENNVVTPGKVKVIIEIEVKGDKTFEVDVKLDRELQVSADCEVADYLSDEDKVTDDISESKLLQSIAHVLSHELEDHKEKVKNLPN